MSKKMTNSRQPFIVRLIRWRFFFLVNIILIIFLGMTFGREFFRSREIQGEIDKLQAQADSLAARNVELTELQTAIQTQSYIEREARLKLGMKKPGENTVIMQDKQEETSGIVVKDGADSSDPLGLVLKDGENKKFVANSTKWWYYFFDKSAFKTIIDYEN